ncbi:replication initiation and membrane attachment family protein [Aquibacillus albus]|uniref:Replication initiation and membrane attachment protein n=1 Tax=Aquibacillus albus TaxID=1168171 RepID=A0ABS2N1L7_9BACI|nr:DnaD domain protein [Aquibacillus albus]MBM7571958.1 replication initiation and membrane attachment protein [Aquibacillus albus]
MTANHIGKLLPVEGYFSLFRGEISTTYFQSLTHLYQPLIGIHAISLYQTLLTETQVNLNSSPQTHHTLMTYLSLPLDEIYKARLKLEGIGLLETYKKQSEPNSVYIYQLHPPFSPGEFFKDGMLSQLLYHQLGNDKYNNLYQAFVGESSYIADQSDNITARFDEVFQSQKNFQILAKNHHQQKQSEPTKTGPAISKDVIDFGWMEHMLHQRMIQPSKILTPSNRKLMTQMVVLYDLTSQELENALLWAINDENYLDVSEFKVACLDIFKSGTQKNKPNLVDQKPFREENQSKPKSKEEQFIQMLENISPRQLLEDLSGGNEASPQDLKVVGDVMTQQGLSSGVMNVLVHYVLLKTDMKLSKAYLEKIASHWARKNIKTVRQAMVLAKSENKKYQQWGSYKKQNKTNKKEVIPEWFNNSQQNNGAKSDTKQTKEDINELLKNYTKNKQSINNRG